MYDRQVLAGPSSDLADLIDAAALLWRIQLRGGEPGRRWADLATGLFTELIAQYPDATITGGHLAASAGTLFDKFGPDIHSAFVVAQWLLLESKREMNLYSSAVPDCTATCPASQKNGTPRR